MQSLNTVISTVTGCVPICAFASLLGISLGITSSAVGLKICVTTAGIKKYKSKEKEARQISIAR